MRLPPSGWDDVAAQEWTASDAAHWSAIAMPTMSDMAAFLHQLSADMEVGLIDRSQAALPSPRETVAIFSREAWI